MTSPRKYNIDSLQDESTADLYRRRLDGKLDQTIFDTTEDLYKYITKNIHEAAMEALGENQRKGGNKNLYFWNKEIEEMVKVKKEKYNKWLNTEDKIEF